MVMNRITVDQKKSSRWGWGIASLYLSFVIFMLSLVGYASMHSSDLVESDYYAKGQAYQQRIEEQKRTAALPERPSLNWHSARYELDIQFPESLRASLVKSSVKFYRPSHMQSDFSIPVTLNDSGACIINDQRLQSGFWRVELTWTSNGETFRVDSEMMITR